MTDYPKNFYDEIEGTAAPSARRIAPLVRDLVAVASVVDVGCGTGAWLRAFAADGVGDVLGLDGGRVREEKLLIEPGKFMCCDLREKLPVERSFDLTISLEVAEHLDEEYAASFVSELTRLAPAELFGKHGYEVIDTILAGMERSLGNRVVQAEYPAVCQPQRPRSKPQTGSCTQGDAAGCADPCRPPGTLWDYGRACPT